MNPGSETGTIEDLSSKPRVHHGGSHATLADPCSDSVWEEIISCQPSTLFHSPAWLRLIRDTYDFQFRSLILSSDGVFKAAVPYATIDTLGVPSQVTLPFSDFCGIISRRPADANAIAEEMLAQGMPWTLRTPAVDTPETSLAPAVKKEYKWHEIHISEDNEQNLAAMNSGAQRSIARAQRSGITIVLAENRRQLRTWFELHLRLRKLKYSVLVQPYEFFERLWDAYIEPGNGFMLLAIQNGEIVAGEINLIWRQTVYSKFAASSPNQDLRGMNHLLVWHALEESRRRGCVIYDMGRTPVSQTGLSYFKRSLGGVESDITALTYEPDGPLPPTALDFQRTVGNASRILAGADVPDDVSESAGNLLYRYFA